jgi:preprotein translocase subunit YajC
MTALPFASLALLQATSPQSLLPPLIMYGSIFAIFYFLVIRPQQQQRKKHEAAMLEIKKGDRIVTAGGVVGEVQHIKAGATAGPDDEITIKSGDSRLVVERGRIAKIGAPGSTVTVSDRAS